MPITNRVVSKKYYNALKNDSSFSTNLSDYTNNLTGNLMEYVKAEFVMEIGWDSIASSTNYWTITLRSAGNYEIRRATGSFATDGWGVGNSFDFFTTYSTVPVLFCTGIVTFISDDGSYLFSSATLDITPHGLDNAIMARADQSNNYINSLIYSPNLIENDAPFSTASLQSNIESAYSTSNARSVTPVQLTELGINKSFSSGFVYVNYEGDVATYFQSYKISHTFVIFPYWFEGNDLNTLTPPSFLSGPASLKYVFLADFRTLLSDPNTSKKSTFENNRGSVGFFNETITGGASTYTIKSIEYDNDFDRLLLQTTTTVTFTLEGSFSVPNTMYGVFFSYLPSEAEYSSNNNFYDNFLYDYALNSINVTSLYPSEIISSVTSSIVGLDLVIIATFDFDVDLQSILSNQKDYCLAIQVGDTSLANTVSDRVMLFGVQNNFASDTLNNDLIIFNSIVATDYNGDSGANIVAYNEDGLSIAFDFDLDLAKDAVLTSLSANLVAYNSITDEYFNLDTYSFDLSGVVVSSGIQQINIDTTRGYFISNSSQFNEISLQTNSLVVDLQNYSGVIAQKINWLSWVANPNADTVFFDSLKPNNNLNFLSSNYANGLNDYEITMQFKATCTGLDPYGANTIQDYVFYGDNIIVYDYLKDGNVTPKTVPTIETFNGGGNVNFMGNISITEDTLFRITWDFINPIGTTSGASAVHRIERFEQNGTSIYELSSFDPLIDVLNSPLRPIAGEDYLLMSIVSGNLVTECLIDYTKLTQNAIYSLSGRVINI